MGSSKSYVIQGVILLAVYGLLFKTSMGPGGQSQRQSDFEGAELNVGYPTLDFVLLAMSSILVRIAWALRGGSMARSWVFLCAGFTAVGALRTSILLIMPCPFLIILYLLLVFLVALAGYYQLRMLRQ